MDAVDPAAGPVRTGPTGIGLSAEDRDLALRRYPPLRFFAYGHLPPNLQVVSAPFARTAFSLALGVDHSAETAVAIRKLLEAKDAAVRAVVAATAKPSSQAGDPDTWFPEVQ